MPEFKTMAELADFLRGKVQSALQNEVAWNVQAAMIDAIQSEVYGAYDPEYYERRYMMSDLGNIETTVDDLTLTSKNKTPPNDFYIESMGNPATTNKELDQVIETGSGYDFWPDAFARPFYQVAIEKLEKGNVVPNAIKKALQAQGVTVKII